MGWDAYAFKIDKTLNVPVDLEREFHNEEVHITASLKDLRLKKYFERAASEVRGRTGVCDWLLPLGGLDVSTCGLMIERATLERVWTPVHWSPRFVANTHRYADWNFDYHEIGEAWAYWSARMFMRTCADLGLGIYFTN